jgi:hypothetical protein
MSEQVRKLTTEQNHDGHTDLSELSASKDLHRKIDALPAPTPDLASASISSSSFARASSQGRPLAERTPQSINTNSLTRDTKRHTSVTQSAPSNANGIFKNPAYPYRGGLISKIITFFANLLKVLERIFLRLIGGRDTVAPTPRHQPTQAPKAAQKDRNEDARESREQSAQSIHRS